MKELAYPTRTISIWMCGSIETAREACRRFCIQQGLCITISPTDYIFTGGCESGFRIGLINYPRFPVSEAQLLSTARDLGQAVLEACCQQSYTIQAPSETIWISRREDLDKKLGVSQRDKGSSIPG